MSNPFSILSLKDKHSDLPKFSKKLEENFAEFGFCGIRDHGIDTELVEEVLQIFKTFFSLSDETKLQYHNPDIGGARGYTPFKIETPKGGSLADLKEFWHVGREIPDDHPYREWMHDNYRVPEIPSFKKKTTELFDQFDALGKEILDSIGHFLNLEKDFFPLAVDEGNSIMRPIHYPPVVDGDLGERAGAHEDINLITLLVGGHQKGLEILTKSNEWIDVKVENDVIVCNIGDMMQRLTNNYLVSTTHRVRATEAESNSPRYSIPFFVHPNPDWLIETLANCYNKNNPNLYPQNILAEEYLQQRLKEIKLIQ